MCQVLSLSGSTIGDSVLKGLELCHPDSHHSMVVGKSDSLSLGVEGVQYAEGKADLFRTFVDEVASGSPGGELLVVEHSVLGEVEQAVAIRVSCTEISSGLSHQLLHGLGAFLHRSHECSVDLLCFLCGIGCPVLQVLRDLGSEACFELGGQGG